MRQRLFFPTIGIGVLFACSAALAQVEGSHAFMFPENDNRLIALQAKGGNPDMAGAVKIKFFGHMAFKVTSPEGTTVLVDPWRNDPSGAWGKWFSMSFRRCQSTSLFRLTHTSTTTWYTGRTR